MSTATLTQIAEACQLSAVTVSVILRNPEDPRYAPKTRERVLETARAMNYVPNLAARSLRKGRSMMLALVIPYNNTELMDEVQRAAQENGYGLILEFTPEPNLTAEDKALEIAVSRQVDGLIWMPAPVRRLTSSHDLPIVLRNRMSSTTVISFSGDIPAEFNRVYVDYYRGLETVVEHFATGGYQEILYVTCAYERSGFHFGAVLERLCTARKLKFSSFDANHDFELPLELDARLKENHHPMGIFGTDFACFEALAACKRAGRSIPNEVGILAYGDLMVGGRYRLGEFTSQSLSAIRVPYGDLGKAAVSSLIKNLSTSEAPTTSEHLYPELIQRSSTLAARATNQPDT